MQYSCKDIIQKYKPIQLVKDFIPRTTSPYCLFLLGGGGGPGVIQFNFDLSNPNQDLHTCISSHHIIFKTVHDLITPNKICHENKLACSQSQISIRKKNFCLWLYSLEVYGFWYPGVLTRTVVVFLITEIDQTRLKLNCNTLVHHRE